MRLVGVLGSVALVALLACGTTSRTRGGAATVAPSTVPPPVEATFVPVDVAVGIDAAQMDGDAVADRGILVVSWLEPAAAEEFRRSRQLPPASIVPFVARAHVAAMDRATLLAPAGVLVRLHAPEASAAVPIAVFDGDKAFWPAVMGAPGRALIGVASRTGGSVRVALEQLPPQPSHGGRFECSGERFVSLDVDGDGVTPARKACAYLPESYAREPGRRYPVVYLLAGLGGNETVRFSDAKLLAHADALGRRQQEAILVGVDTRSPGGSIYVTTRSLPALTHTVAAVDGRLRTIVGAAGRALLGQSTGGFNAISAALLAPDVFGAVGASAPDALDLDSWLLEPDGNIREQWLAWMRLEDAIGGTGQMLSYAESWGPSGPSGAANIWPAELDTGHIRRAVLDAWLSHSPARMARTPEGGRALARARGKIFISASRADEFGLFEPARRFSETLQQLGIPHEFMADEGGHFDVRSRLSDLLGRLLAVLPSAADGEPHQPAPS